MSNDANVKGIRSVILSSSLGTLIEWYDFYIFGSLAVVISEKFFPAGNPTASPAASNFESGYNSNNESKNGVLAASTAFDPSVFP